MPVDCLVKLSYGVDEEPNSAVVVWTGDRSWFTGELAGGHSVDVDEPEPVGGNHGPRPPDLLLLAAASCSGISAQAILRKMRQPVTALTVRASGSREPDWPRAFTRILLSFDVTVGAGSNRELIDKAIDRAVKKYCPVSATIESGEGGTVVEYEISVTEDR